MTKIHFPQTRRHTARYQPLLELLEVRLAPASYTWDSVLGTLAVSLGTGESATVRNNAGTRSFALTAGTFTQVGGDAAPGSGSATLSFAAANNISGSVAVNNTGAGAGTNNVTFDGIGSTDALNSATISVAITAASTLGTIAFTDGFDIAATTAIALTTVRDISVGSGSVISSSVSGSITLSANQQATATTGTFAGINVNGGTISTSGTGDILLQGRGGDVQGGGGHHGIWLQNGGRVESTAAGANAGTVTLDGTGGNSPIETTTFGVLISGANSLVTSVDGDVLVKGQGGDSSGFSNVSNNGVGLTSGGQVTSTGTAKLSLDGTGGIGPDTGSGVVITGVNSRVTSVNGDILVMGMGGDSLRSFNGGNIGVSLVTGGQVTSTGLARITLDGTGGTSPDLNIGVWINGTGALVTSVTGDILLKGKGGISPGSDNYGVALDAGGQVRSSGAAQVTLDGTGGIGTVFNQTIRQHGVLVRGANSLVTSVDGDVLIQGVGGDGGGANFGVHVNEGSQVTSTGTAQVTLNGTGGTGTNPSLGSYGVSIESLVTSLDGDILIKGQGGNSAGTRDNTGVGVIGQVISTGTAKVTLDGTGGNGTSGNYGVHIANGRVNSVDGAILIKGKGGDGSSTSNTGVKLGGQVNSTGAATIIFEGTAGTGTTGNVGAAIDGGASLTSATGDILITGIGGGSAGAGSHSNPGVTIAGPIASTGTATVTIDGTGGAGAFLNDGVTMRFPGQVSSVDGDIAITGQAGAGSPSVGIDTFRPVTATGNADISLVADSMNIFSGPNISSPNTVTLKPKTPGTAINLGGADAVGALGLLDGELDTITAGTLIIGATDSGPMTVSGGGITRPAATDLRLISGGDIVFSSGGQVNTAGGPLLLDPGTAPAALKAIRAGADATASTVSFGSALNLSIAINGTTVDSQYTQLNVAAALDLTGATLELTGAFVPATDNVFVIVSATSRTGLFTGLAENDVVTFNGKQLRVNYTSTTVTLTASAGTANAAPVAVDDSASTSEDNAVDIPVLDNDTDADTVNADLRVQQLSNVHGGTAVVLPDGRTVRFTPAANANDGNTPGGFGFSYTANDGTNTSANAAAVTISVTAAAAAAAHTPSVTNATTTEDTQTISGLVISRNAADGTEVTHFKIANITGGSLFQNDGTTPIGNGSFITFAQANAGLKFTPAVNFFGTSGFDVQASLSASDAGLGGDAAIASITVVRNGNVSVGQVVSAASVNAGKNVKFTLTARNLSATSATAIKLRDAIPAGATFVSFTAPGGWVVHTPPAGGQGTVTATRVSLAARGEATFQLVVRVGRDAAVGSFITNTATVSMPTADDNPRNNTATARTRVLPAPRETLSVTILSRSAAYSNELGVFLVDDASGRIGGLHPGDAGYAQTALSRRRLVFSATAPVGTSRSLPLPTGGFFGMYLVQNATSVDVLTRNPGNHLGHGPVAFFTFPAANPDGFHHIRLLAANVFGFEDLTSGGDKDFNDLVVKVNRRRG